MLYTIWFIRADVQVAACALLAVPALLRGGSPEHRLALSLVLATATDYACALFLARRPIASVDVVALGVDLLLFTGILAVALRDGRAFSLWVGGAQIVVVASHFARAVLPQVPSLAYVLMMRMPMWVQVMAIAIALMSRGSCKIGYIDRQKRLADSRARGHDAA